MPMRVTTTNAVQQQLTIGDKFIPPPSDGATARQVMDWAAMMSGKEIAKQFGKSDQLAEAYLSLYHPELLDPSK